MYKNKKIVFFFLSNCRMLIQVRDITYLIANDCAMRTTVYQLVSVSELVVAHNSITRDKTAAI